MLFYFCIIFYAFKLLSFINVLQTENSTVLDEESHTFYPTSQQNFTS